MNDKDFENTEVSADHENQSIAGVEQPVIKGQKKPRKDKVAKSGSRKAMIICSVIAAVIVIIGVVATCIWFFMDRGDDDDEVMPEGGRTEEITGGDENHTWLY